MNAAKRFYCRVYQTAFRAALPFLPYRDPRALESVEQVPAVLAQQGCKKPLIVTGHTVHGSGLVDPLKAALADAGLDFAVFDETVANPTVAVVEAARERYGLQGCDCLIAFGGGSPMDCAKAVGARLARPDKTLQQMGGVLRVRRAIPLLVAVPTTAGTGSETTLASVIVDEQTHRKYAINDFPLIPSYAVLDYRNTLSLPPHVTAATGMDALVHAVEAYIGRSTTAGTRADAEAAVALVSRHLQRAYDDGADVEARRGMLQASFRAGAAFSKSYVGYVHAIAHSLGGRYGIAHGLANAVICPYVLEAYGRTCQRKLARLARVAGCADDSLDDATAACAFIGWFRELNARMGIPTHLDCIRLEDVPDLARLADAEANPLYPVPRLMDAYELEGLYRAIAL